MRKIQLLLMLLITSVITFGQVGINTGNPNINAGLHISERIDPASTAAPDKFNGVIIQRYTTAERNTLSLGAAENGLTIYNKDTNCYDYWNGTSSKWSSICGKLGPSEFNVGSIDCSTDISLNGSYTTDTGLTTSEYIKIKVNITSPGSYDLGHILLRITDIISLRLESLQLLVLKQYSCTEAVFQQMQALIFLF